ncbi:MAG: phospholipase D-like domain-containing protein [Deltaproteobacteria bacterium]
MKTHYVFVVAWVIFFVIVGQCRAYDEKTVCEVELLTNTEYRQALISEIKKARSEIVMSFYVFKTSNKNRAAHKVLEQLVLAAQRGVSVRVILERTKNGKDELDMSNKETALILKQAGIDVCFDSPSRTTHTKLVVIDGRYVFIGSHNLTPSALERNNEASILIDSTKIAQEAKEYMRYICH